MEFCRFFSLLATGLVLLPSPGGAVRWISPNGDDRRGTGTQDRPFRTLARACADLKDGTGMTVRLMDGVYELDRPVVIGRTLSGLTIEAAPDAVPVVSGGRRIAEWKPDARGWWRARPPKGLTTSQFYVNGVRRQRPYWPRKDYCLLESAAEPDPQGRIRAVCRPGDVDPTADGLDRAEFFFFHVWTTSRMPMAGYDPSTRILTLGHQTLDNPKNHAFNEKTAYRIDNLRAALGEPGDWYQETDGELVYVPMPGEEIGRVETVAANLERLLVFDWATNVTVRGVAFAYQGWNMPAGGIHCGQAAYQVKAAVESVGSAGLRFENCTFAHLGTWGLNFGQVNSDCSAVRCHFSDLGAGGIKVFHGATGCVVEDCLIEDGGKVIPGGCGIWVGLSGGNRISHNTIRRMFYSGVSVGWKWAYGATAARDNVIEWNDIGDIGNRVLADMGGVYLLGEQPGTVIRNNFIHGVDCRIDGNGLYFDSGSSCMTATNNVILKCSRMSWFTADISRDLRIERNALSVEQTGFDIRQTGCRGHAGNGCRIPEVPRVFPGFDLALLESERYERGLALLPTPSECRLTGGDFFLRNQDDIRYERDDGLPRDGYRLTVGAEGVRIRHAGVSGKVYALQTLRQLTGDSGIDALVLSCPVRIPCCVISDHPRFRWRGYMLDTVRHFFPTETVLRMLDLMAYHKLNVFHWHLADTTGWRFPMDEYPALTNQCAVRACREKRTSPYYRDTAKGTYGPYAHSLEDIRRVVLYARERGIVVVPEIDLPGHQGINGVFRFACCQGGDPIGTNRWNGTVRDVCVGNREMYRFYERVFDRICEVFPSKFIHIGGDEVVGKDWMICPKCRRVMENRNIEGPRALQNVVMRHFAEYLERKGRVAVGWDEILEGGEMPESTMMMKFHGGGNGHLTALAKGHRVVFAPSTQTYFDSDQGLFGDTFDTYQIFNPRVDWKTVYAFDPLADVPEANRRLVAGVEGCSWTELACDRADIEWTVFPRLSALAEVVWAYPGNRDSAHFLPRLAACRERLVRMGVGAARVGPLRPVPPYPIPLPAFRDVRGFVVCLKASLEASDVKWIPDVAVPVGGYEMTIASDASMGKAASISVRHADAEGRATAWHVLRQLAEPKSSGVVYLPKGTIRSWK